ncbi:MAG: hypothetical protein ACYC6N_03635 [Pirellulaceae bacterium]
MPQCFALAYPAHPAQVAHAGEGAEDYAQHGDKDVEDAKHY